MAFFNYVTKEITLKVVYYGPGLSGKTTNLQNLYSALDPSSRGKFISLATESDRTLFFDFLPVELGRIKDFSIRFQLYTVPGQIRYNATRKLVLKGADAIVFVADSQRDMREQNIESRDNMRENLLSNNLDPETIPVVLQYNKRDLPNILSIDELEHDLNSKNYQNVEAVAVNGKGVEETFRLATKILLKDIVQKHKVEASPLTEEIIEAKPPERVVSEPAPVSAHKVAEGVAKDFVLHHGREVSESTGESVSVSMPEEPAFDVLEARRPSLGAEQQKTSELLSEKRPQPDTRLVEKLDSLEAGLQEIRQALTGIRESLTSLSSAIKESGRHQSDMMKTLKEINRTLTDTGRKRRWYQFVSK